MKTTHSTAAQTFLGELLGTRAWTLLQHAVAQPVSWEADDSLDRGQAAMALGLVLLEPPQLESEGTACKVQVSSRHCWQTASTVLTVATA